MPFAAITYKVKPGNEDRIAEIFANFRRVNSPTLRDDSGVEVGKLLGTAVFIKDELMVRVIHYEGDFSAISGHMSAQQGVHALEKQLAPYLAEQRDTSNRDGFDTYFKNSTMRCISQLSIDTLPQAG
ncbi:SchA/CurD-like domain-containing protein [Nocardia sp. CDC153]|uniref:SchA/CurD-like domain-containing protein n=1 Tax=Nocardia sp. CDC153 TaxID=3112167 RepID=UPI002DB71419|nr:SchA/CurD-like domain-containing protein [Nocardia sp. CDC153]MEC3952007.1 SchA/CurD-like domain-containing protein [Nocardia sp. CDC153]